MKTRVSPEVAAQVDSWIRDLMEMNRTRTPDTAEALDSNLNNAFASRGVLDKVLAAFEAMSDDDPVEIDLECRLHIALLGRSETTRTMDAFIRARRTDPVLYARLKRFYCDEYSLRFGHVDDSGRRLVFRSPAMPDAIFPVIERIERV